MKKIVVYDFDKTLTYKDTLWGFFTVAGRERALFVLKMFMYVKDMILAKAGLITNTELKKRGVRYFLKGLSAGTIEELSRVYVKQIRLNRLYRQMIDTMQNDTDYFVVSASFETYVRLLFPDNVTVIGSRLAYKNGHVDSLAFNCYKEAKRSVLHETGIYAIDLLYTDSYSDAALAEMAKKIVVVDKDNLKVCEDAKAFRECFVR